MALSHSDEETLGLGVCQTWRRMLHPKGMLVLAAYSKEEM